MPVPDRDQLTMRLQLLLTAGITRTDLPMALLLLREQRLCLRIGFGVSHQHANASRSLCLRPRRNRPSRRAAKKCDELAPSHWFPPSLGMSAYTSILAIPIRDWAPGNVADGSIATGA